MTAPRGPGRPPIGNPFYGQLGHLRDLLEAEAKREGVPMAEQMRRILTEHYEKGKTK
jgi:hypothetical protein